MRKFKTFADALTAAPATAQAAPIAANDNHPPKPRKKPEPRYRGTLPALRWLYDNHPDLAEPVAEAVQSLAGSAWDTEASDSMHVQSPTIGEIIKAASNGENEDGTPNWLKPTVEKDSDGNLYVALGDLRFVRGELVEFGKTAKGRRLQPRERMVSREEDSTPNRNPSGYIGLHATTPSPLHAASYQRPFSGEPALPPMYDPLEGVEEARAVLSSFGVDGSVLFDDLPFPATKCPAVIAKGAEFIGGVVQSCGNASAGALIWDAPEIIKGEVRRVVEEVASGATLKEIGVRFGYSEGYADRGIKAILIEAAKILRSANDNRRQPIKKSA